MLDAQSIDLHYGAAQALRGVSIKAEPGKVTCVLGRNGVGKTSLLDALAGQYPISRGTITWEDDDITALRPPERARRGIAYVPQGREIFPLLTVEVSNNSWPLVGRWLCARVCCCSMSRPKASSPR